MAATQRRKPGPGRSGLSIKCANVYQKYLNTYGQFNEGTTHARMVELVEAGHIASIYVAVTTDGRFSDLVNELPGNNAKAKKKFFDAAIRDFRKEPSAAARGTRDGDVDMHESCNSDEDEDEDGRPTPINLFNAGKSHFNFGNESVRFTGGDDDSDEDDVDFGGDQFRPTKSEPFGGSSSRRTPKRGRCGGGRLGSAKKSPKSSQRSRGGAPFATATYTAPIPEEIREQMYAKFFGQVLENKEVSTDDIRRWKGSGLRDLVEAEVQQVLARKYIKYFKHITPETEVSQGWTGNSLLDTVVDQVKYILEGGSAEDLCHHFAGWGSNELANIASDIVLTLSRENLSLSVNYTNAKRTAERVKSAAGDVATAVELSAKRMEVTAHILDDNIALIKKEQAVLEKRLKRYMEQKRVVDAGVDKMTSVKEWAQSQVGQAQTIIDLVDPEAQRCLEGCALNDDVWAVAVKEIHDHFVPNLHAFDPVVLTEFGLIDKLRSQPNAGEHRSIGSSVCRMMAHMKMDDSVADGGASRTGGVNSQRASGVPRSVSAPPPAAADDQSVFTVGMESIAISIDPIPEEPRSCMTAPANACSTPGLSFDGSRPNFGAKASNDTPTSSSFSGTASDAPSMSGTPAKLSSETVPTIATSGAASGTDLDAKPAAVPAAEVTSASAPTNTSSTSAFSFNWGNSKFGAKMPSDTSFGAPASGTSAGVVAADWSGTNFATTPVVVPTTAATGAIPRSFACLNGTPGTFASDADPGTNLDAKPAAVPTAEAASTTVSAAFQFVTEDVARWKVFAAMASDPQAKEVEPLTRTMVTYVLELPRFLEYYFADRQVLEWYDEHASTLKLCRPVQEELFLVTIGAKDCTTVAGIPVTKEAATAILNPAKRAS